jgi:hypothetical protein
MLLIRLSLLSMLHCLLVAALAFTGNGAPQVQQDCTRPGVECVDSLTGEVNKNAQTAAAAAPDPDISGLNPTRAPNSAPASPFAITLPECQARLTDREAGFQNFNVQLNSMKADVYRVQDALKAVEESTQTILQKETAFSTELIEMNKLLASAQERANLLTAWENDETHVRSQLSDLFNTLEKDVLVDSKQLLGMSDTLRQALRKMEIVHDETSQVLTKVADAESAMYVWAFNATSKVNDHTNRVVSIAQETQFRMDQVTSAKIITDTLLEIVERCRF